MPALVILCEAGTELSWEVAKQTYDSKNRVSFRLIDKLSDFVVEVQWESTKLGDPVVPFFKIHTPTL